MTECSGCGDQTGKVTGHSVRGKMVYLCKWCKKEPPKKRMAFLGLPSKERWNTGFLIDHKPAYDPRRPHARS